MCVLDERFWENNGSDDVSDRMSPTTCWFVQASGAAFCLMGFW